MQDCDIEKHQLQTVTILKTKIKKINRKMRKNIQVRELSATTVITNSIKKVDSKST